MYLLTGWEGGKGKYMAQGPCVLSESRIFSHPARPNSVDEHFTIWLSCFWIFLTERKRVHGSICLVSLSLCAYGPHTGLFYHMVFQRNCARDRKRRIINYFLERNFTKLLTKEHDQLVSTLKNPPKSFFFREDWHISTKTSAWRLQNIRPTLLTLPSHKALQRQEAPIHQFQDPHRLIHRLLQRWLGQRVP